MILLPPRPPGFNLTHPMAYGAVLSWTADGQLGGYNRVNRVRGTVSGSMTSGATAFLGKTLNFTTTSQYITFPRLTAYTENVVTYWGLLAPSSVSANQDIMNSGNSSGTGWDFVINSSALFQIRNVGGAVQYSSGIALTLNAPYLLICSVSYLRAYFLVKRLDTGVISTSSVTVTAPTAIASGTMGIGGDINLNNSCHVNYAACAYSYTALTTGEMIKLAADPWGPFRPWTMPVEQYVAGGVRTAPPPTFLIMVNK